MAFGGLGFAGGPGYGFPGGTRVGGLGRPRMVVDGKKKRKKRSLAERLAERRAFGKLELELGAPTREREERLAEEAFGRRKELAELGIGARAEEARLGREAVGERLGRRIEAGAEEARLGREAGETRLGMTLAERERESDIRAAEDRARLEQAREFEMGREQRAAAGEEAATERLRLGASLRAEEAERAFRRKPTREERLLQIQQDEQARAQGRWAGFTRGAAGAQDIPVVGGAAPTRVVSPEAMADFTRLSPADQKEWIRRYPEYARQ